MVMAVKETPPDDDVCPICFSDYVLPYRADCGHWFCGSCILQLWNYGNALQPCKCPMCSRLIKILTPGVVTLQNQDQRNEAEFRKMVKAIDRYNRLFVGGALGFVQRLRETPLFIRRMFLEMADPNQVDAHFCEWRIVALILALLYVISPFNFSSKIVNIDILGNLIAVVLVTVVKLVGWYQRRRSAERVRRFAAADEALIQPQSNNHTL